MKEARPKSIQSVQVESPKTPTFDPKQSGLKDNINESLFWENVKSAGKYIYFVRMA
jgi:hypothetical protein